MASLDCTALECASTGAPAAHTDDSKVPVTVITGYLGSGKTTLLNRILTEMHGKRVAVIENEFGEIGIDDALVLAHRLNSTEEIFEMNNGCICCTVRGDLIRLLTKLLTRPGPKLDAVIIETTGLADPAPVAQTFFASEEVKAWARLDGIITVADARHLTMHLDDAKPEGAENEAEEQVLFADKIVLNKMDLVTAEEAAEVSRRIRLLNATAQVLPATNADVDLRHVLGVRAFDLSRILTTVDPDFLAEGAEHVHDSTITSVGIARPGECDLAKLNAWFTELLAAQGVNIYRMKGVLAIQGLQQKYVFQGVHMMFQGEPLGVSPWLEGEARHSKLVFIGRHLDRAALEAGFAACVV